jgi:hypothetical protein
MSIFFKHYLVEKYSEGPANHSSWQAGASLLDEEA